MKTFIKVIEIWIPDEDRMRLKFGSGLYGTLTEFKSASGQHYFEFGEGLPGKAWELGHPIVLSEFERSYFKRTEAAHKAGLTCAIALPLFSGEFLLAVVVFLCGDDEEHAGAIEVWSNNDSNDSTLHLMDGYYGNLGQFEQISRRIRIEKGEGIPGLVWEQGMPVLMEDISSNAQFARSRIARSVGITTGLGIPAGSCSGKIFVLTFLSAKATPIAKRIQIWTPDEHGKQLICKKSYSKNSNNLAEIFETLHIDKGVGALGRVWLTGMPSLSGSQDITYDPELDNLSRMLAIPVIEQGKMKAIVSFLF